MKSKFVTALLGLSLISIPGLVSPAFAQGNGKGPCAQDARKYCSGLKWGQGLGKCLEEHQSDLSGACKERIAQAKQNMKTFQEACKSDVNQFCSDIQPGKGRIIRCLKSNESKLSGSCRSELTSRTNRKGGSSRKTG